MWLLGGVVHRLVESIVELPPIIRKIVCIQTRHSKFFHERDLREKKCPESYLTDEDGHSHDDTRGYKRNERSSECIRKLLHKITLKSVF